MAATPLPKLPKGTPTWNGALGQAQLAWLEKNLNEAKRAGEKVILFCHFPVFPKDVHNLWNAKHVLSVLTRHPHVVAYMNGHNHAGGYGKLSGQHYVTFKGMVNTHETAYSVVHVHRDRLEIKGEGRQQDKTLPLPAASKKAGD